VKSALDRGEYGPLKRIRNVVSFREITTAAFALLASAGVVTAGLVLASGSGGNDEPKREAIVDTSPVQQAPRSYLQRGAPSFALKDLPRTFGALKVLPPGSAIVREMAYGDERDTWKYARATADSLAQVPQDEIVRLPSLPAGYEIRDVAYTVGSSTDGSRSQLSELQMTFSDGAHFDISVSISRPTEFARGMPYPIVASSPDNPLVVDVGDVAGQPAIFQFMKPDHQGQGIEEVITADGEFLIVVSSFRGVDFGILVAAASSLKERK